jgi:RHS repeat-associated protein
VYGEDAFVPLARVDAVADSGGAARAEARNLHTDHLGTPREMTDADGRVVWAARYRAWGSVLEVVQEEVSMSHEIGKTQPVRFQGQYYDNESGLHYNQFRYYDPDIGRFVSSDPIGLFGGTNSFQYAPNLVGWIEPIGLASYDPGVYGVHFEARLPKDMYILTDAEHFSEGNRQLYYAIKNCPALASALEAKYPGLSEYVGPTRLGTFRGKAFSGTTWHHHGQVGGLLQLVDRADHASRHLDYHANGVGGRNTWGGGTRCR